jgi:hypothetical protein
MICLVFMPTKKAQAFTLIELALVSIPLIISTNFLDGSGIEFNEPDSSDDPEVVLSKLSNTNQWTEIARAPYNPANGSYSFSNLNKNELAGQIIQLEVISGDLIGKKEIMKIDSNPSTEIQIDFNQNNTLKSFLIEHLRLEYNQTLSAENARAEIKDHLLQNTIDIPWSSDLEAFLELVNSSNSYLVASILETRELTLIESMIILAKIAESKSLQAMLKESFPIVETSIPSLLNGGSLNERYYELSNLVSIGSCLKNATSSTNPLECVYLSNLFHFNQNNFFIEMNSSYSQLTSLLSPSKASEINSYLESIGAEDLFNYWLENLSHATPIEISSYLGTSLRAQQAYYFEQSVFANTFTLLGIDPPPTSSIYSFSIINNVTTDYSISYTIADRSNSENKFLVGAMVFDNQSQQFLSILCVSDNSNSDFSINYYPLYDFNSKVLSCAAGTSEFDDTQGDLTFLLDIFSPIVVPALSVDAKLAEAKNVVGSLTRAAQAYSLENGVLPSINSDLGVSVTSPTGYSLSKVNTGTVFYVIHDIDNVGSEYKFIISGTAIKADSSSVTILCMSDTAGILIDVSHYPAYNVGSETFSCASGTSVVP